MPEQASPRDVPDLWWSPTMGMLQKIDGGFRAAGGGSEMWQGLFSASQFPVDAVQLQPVQPDPSRDEMLASLTELITQTVPQDVIDLLQAALDEQLALQAKLDAVLAVCARGEWQATRWEQPFPVPSWVTDVRAAAQDELAVAPSPKPKCCPDCGAVGHGNATCRTCHLEWRRAGWHKPCEICQPTETPAPFVPADQAFPEERP